jgi:hypothetical protein
MPAKQTNTNTNLLRTVGGLKNNTLGCQTKLYWMFVLWLSVLLFCMIMLMQFPQPLQALPLQLLHWLPPLVFELWFR